MVAHTSRAVTTTMTSGHTVPNSPGEYVTQSPRGCALILPEHRAPTCRKD